MSTIEAPLEWVETVGDLRLPPKTNQRLQDLRRFSRLPNVGLVQDRLHLAALLGSQAIKRLDHGVVGNSTQ